MTIVLAGKLLRDVRIALLVVCSLLLAFECLWARITQRITEEILPTVTRHVPLAVLMDVLFRGPGQIIQTLMGGDLIDLRSAHDVLSISAVHPLIQTILCIWAVGRAAGAIAGEIDRGTMELLLAQPITRRRLVLAHLLVDVMVIPLLCLAMCAGQTLGVAIFGQIDLAAPPDAHQLRINPFDYVPGFTNAAALVFAVSGLTMPISAAGRFRNRALGIAILVVLCQFLINVIGQLWPVLGPLRPFTVFYYYQPQRIVLVHNWTVNLAAEWHTAWPLHVNVMLVLTAAGLCGYGLASWIFSRRDLPAPL
jgi:ABC-2 type transport system permease protein